MKILVCGSRHLLDQSLVDAVLDGLGGVSVIIQGGARGADALAKYWAQKNNIHVKEYQAEWGRYGRAAGPLRNRKMLEETKPDLVLAFLAPGSRGTRNMIDQAERGGFKVKTVLI
jgi:hypothetical protein